MFKQEQLSSSQKKWRSLQKFNRETVIHDLEEKLHDARPRELIFLKDFYTTYKTGHLEHSNPGSTHYDLRQAAIALELSLQDRFLATPRDQRLALYEDTIVPFSDELNKFMCDLQAEGLLSSDKKLSGSEIFLYQRYLSGFDKRINNIPNLNEEHVLRLAVDRFLYQLKVLLFGEPQEHVRFFKGETTNAIAQFNFTVSERLNDAKVNPILGY